MSSEQEAGGLPADPWDRLAGELRARKEWQRSTWGDLDDVTLGRYLAGEAGRGERQRVEQALARSPELQQLTSVLQEVLGELDPVLPAPAVLPMTRARPSRRGLAGTFRGRSSLVAAACLLVVLGVAMPGPQSRSIHAPREATLTLSDGFAARALVASPRLEQPPVPPARNESALEKKAVGDGERLAYYETGVEYTPQQVVRLHQQGMYFRHQGDLARAAQPLSQVHHYCRRKVGPEHPVTRASARRLAGVYVTALNTPPTASASVSTHEPRAVRTKPRGSATPLQHSARQLRDRLAAQPVREIRSSVVPVLAQALREASTTEERRALVRALGQLGAAARGALPVLTDRLEEAADTGEVREVLVALEQMGEAARPAVGLLEAMVGQEKRDAVQKTLSTGPVASQKRVLPAAERALAERVLRRLEGCEGRIGVRDEAGCFSLRALRQSCLQCRQLARETGVEVLIETRPAGPGESSAALKELGPRAIHILIDPAGPAVKVQLSAELQKESVDIENIRESLLAACRQRQFDRGLTEGVRAVRALVAEGR